MFMHTDKSGNDRLSGQVHYFRFRRIRIPEFRTLDTDDFSTLNVDTLILSRHSARAIYDADVIEHQDRRVFADIGLDRGGRLSEHAAGCHHETRGDEQAQKWHAAIPQMLWLVFGRRRKQIITHLITV